MKPSRKGPVFRQHAAAEGAEVPRDDGQAVDHGKRAAREARSDVGLEVGKPREKPVQVGRGVAAAHRPDALAVEGGEQLVDGVRLEDAVRIHEEDDLPRRRRSPAFSADAFPPLRRASTVTPGCVS